MNVNNYLLVFLVGGTISYLVTLVIRRISTQLRLLDLPGARKVHVEAVPYLGGVAVFFGFMMALGVALHLDRPFRYEFLQEFVGLFVATSIIFLLGIFDDLGGSNAATKLTFQGIAATVLWGYGFRIEQITALGGGQVILPAPVGWAATMLWFWAVTNAMNLIDGLDGLCGGIGAIAATTMVVAGFYRGELVLPFVAIALAGTLFGFLPHNFHPARIFLGDTGSLTIGFLIAALGLVSFTKASTVVTLMVPITALAIPVTDTMMALIRRQRMKRNLFQADRMHIHHRLLRLLPHRRAVIMLLILTGYSSVLGIAMMMSSTVMSFWIFLLLVGSLIFVMMMIRAYEKISGFSDWEEE